MPRASSSRYRLSSASCRRRRQYLRRRKAAPASCTPAASMRESPKPVDGVSAWTGPGWRIPTPLWSEILQLSSGQAVTPRHIKAFVELATAAKVLADGLTASLLLSKAANLDQWQDKFKITLPEKGERVKVAATP